MKHIFLVLFSLLIVQEAQAQTKKRIIGYVMGSRLDNLEQEIDVKRLTHINYAFADVIDGEVVEISEKDAANFIYLNELKAKNPKLKILISVGGWGRSGGFSDAVLTKESRERFAESAIDFMLRHRLDGIDLDWEYPGLPGNGNTHRKEDKENFTKALALLRKKLDEKGDFLLTIASASSQRYLDNVEMNKIHESLDFVNIMTYDYFGAWSNTTGNHAQLYPSADKAVQNHLKYGVPSDKIVLGVAFYGRGWTDVEGYKMPAKSEDAFSRNYKDIVKEHSHYTYNWDTLAAAPYLFNETEKILIAFDDPLSMRLKVDYVKQKKLGGIMFWEYTGDNGDLLGTLYSELNAIEGHAHNDYENDEPLIRALNLGLQSIEVDVHLVDDRFYVSHNKPYDINRLKTIEELYLDPLSRMDFIQYPLYLLIDIKTDADPAYEKLREILTKYQSPQITYVISGNRAKDKIANDSLRLMSIDGRPEDIGKSYSAEQMPIISQNYRYFFSDRNPSQISQKEIDRFKTFIEAAHAKHHLVRLWATPDNAEMWDFLKNLGVDLINTDQPAILAKHFRN